MIAAKCRLFFFSLLLPAFLHAGAGKLPLTVLMDFEAPHSETSLGSLRKSLNQIMNPSGVHVVVELREDLPPSPQFGQLVVFKMRGSCTMSPLPIGALSDERGPLAMAYTSDGQVLHFGEVECDRVRHSLERVLGRNFSKKSQQAYGSALAVVIAHELYHMLGNSHKHTETGLTKSALSASDLMNSQLSLPPRAVSAIQDSLHSELPGQD